MKFTLITLLAVLGFSAEVLAEKYVVLFKQAEVSISSMEHSAFQNLLQSSNDKSVGQLKEWLGTRGIRSVAVNNLWLVRGAAVALTPDIAQKLSKEAWVQGVYADQTRKYISPASTVTVANTLKDLGDAGNLWGLKRIGMEKVHAEFPTLTGRGVRVGIIDTGIQSNHPELAGRLANFKDFMTGLPHPYDDHGHGTHVAGTISGAQVGIAPEASIIFAKSFSAVGSAADSQLLAAMQWIFDPDGNPNTNDFPQVVSNSWGGNIADGVNHLQEFLPYQLAMTAWIHGGIIPIFAAGNSGTSPNGFPGGLPEAIAIGAIGPNDAVADFSSRGPNLWKIGELVLSLLKPDISAPGVDIASSFPGNKYSTMSGTSMATPHVTGAVALLLQGNPKLKFAEVKSLLLQASERKADVSFGYGILDVPKLLQLGIGGAQKSL